MEKGGAYDGCKNADWPRIWGLGMMGAPSDKCSRRAAMCCDPPRSTGCPDRVSGRGVFCSTSRICGAPHIRGDVQKNFTH